MKALVTGANGLMGSAVVRALLDDGQEVRALVRHKSDVRSLEGLEIERVHGDFRDPESLAIACKGVQTVYHVGALVAFWLPKPEVKLFDEVNVQGTKNVLRAALDGGAEKVVYTSTIATIGSHGKDDPATEEHIFNGWDVGMEYERSKYSAEFEAWRLGAEGLPLVVVLPCSPIGARDSNPNPIGQLMLDFYHRKLPGYIDSGGNFVDTDDIAMGHVLAAKRGRVGQRYIIGNANVPVVDLFKTLEEVTGVPRPKRQVPYPGALALSHVFKFLSDHATHKPPLLAPNLTRSARLYYYTSIDKARRELGYEPRYSAKGAAVKAYRWFLENGYIQGSEASRRALADSLEQHADAAKPLR